MGEVFDTVIIGSGPAGLTAGIYAGVYKLKFAIVGKDYGLLAGAHEIWNWPGIKAIPGLELVQKIRQHAVEGFNAKIIDDEVVKVSKTSSNFKVETKNSGSLESKALIIATGLQNRKLGIGEERLVGKGVSYCATCDAGMFAGKTVAVIGGNDGAAQAALLLAEYAKKVFIFYRHEALRCQPVYLPKIAEKKNIETVFNSNIVEVIGEKRLERIALEVGGKKKLVELDGLFPEIGAVPQSILFKELGIRFDNFGFILVDCWQKTNVEGVLAAGDITATHSGFKQAIVACAEGAAASNSVFKLLKEKKD